MTSLYRLKAHGFKAYGKTLPDGPCPRPKL
jgi:hypothetical protein